jgi:hypothetical protein
MTNGLYAWRLWEIAGNPWWRSRNVMLRSLVREVTWRGPVLKANCMDVLPKPHEPPGKGCNCGIWGVFSPPSVYTEYVFQLDGEGYLARFAGLIRLIPPALVGTSGVRCRAAVVHHILVPPGEPFPRLVEEMQERYQCDVTVIREHEHMNEIYRRFQPLVDQTKEILSELAADGA